MHHRAVGRRALTVAASLALLFTLLSYSVATEPPADADAQGLSLITETPEEGFAVAVSLSRNAITETQPDTDVLHALRPGYAHDADSLIAVSEVIAENFQTVAAANDYWRASSADADAQGLSLITETPDEGFAVAVSLSRRAITETQPDTDVLHALRPGYANDADSLIAVSNVVAVNFQTVAAANDHWRP